MKTPPILISRTKALSTLCAFGLLVWPGLASAQTLYFWTGTGGGASWTTPANWNNATQTGATATTAPGNAANDSVTINQGSTAGAPVILNNTATTTIGSFNLGSLVSSSAYLQITGTGTKLKPSTAGAYLIGNGNTSTVGLTIKDGGELDFSAATSLSLASGTNSNVTVNLGNGSTSAGTLRGGTTTTTLGSKPGALATLNVNNGGVAIFSSPASAFTLGNTGTGVINVAAGGQLNITAAVTAGSGAGGEGDISVTGGNITTGSAVTLGNGGGISTLTISSGTVSVGTILSVGVGSSISISGGRLTTGANISSNGSLTQSGGVISLGTGFSQTAGSTTITSGTMLGASTTARFTASGSVSLSNALVDFSSATSGVSSLGSGTMTQTSGTFSVNSFALGNAATALYSISGGVFSSTGVINVGSGASGNGTLLVSGGTVSSAAGTTVGNGATVGGGLLGVEGTGKYFINGSNGVANLLTIGTNSGTGSAGTVNLQGGTIAAAAGATNGYGLLLVTPATLTSGTTGSSIKGYGTITLGGSGTKTFTNGGKVVATGANLLSNTGASPTDQTLDLTGSTFTVVTSTNRGAGAGWYAVNHGKLTMNVSGTAAATTLNWGAPSGAFSVNSLVNSAQLTFATAAAPSAVTISLLASDRSDIAALWSQAGLPGGAGSADAIGIWNITNSSGSTWNGLTLRYDDSAVAPLETLALYYITDASGTWSLVSTTIDSSVNFTVSHTGTLNSGYYALLAVPEPNTLWLLAVGAGLVVGVRRLRARSVSPTRA